MNWPSEQPEIIRILGEFSLQAVHNKEEILSTLFWKCFLIINSSMGGGFVYLTGQLGIHMLQIGTQAAHPQALQLL